MIGSRAICLLKNVQRCPVNNKLRQVNLKQVRWSSSEEEWSYRGLPNPPKWATRSATCVAIVTYWWFYWNLWHGWPHLVGLYYGEFLPDPRKFTDEELGIPPAP